jgi:hypothetical protein
MILAVHQPQYLPWLGYLHKIAACDLFIFLDDVQYKKREFQNRNKIKTPQGPLWLTVPVVTKHKQLQKINEVMIDNETGWNGDHWKSIERNYAHADFLGEHRAFFEKLYGAGHDSLSALSMEIIEYMLSYLMINTTRKLSSEFNLTSTSTERIIDLCKKTGADAYLSGAGGKDYMDEALFQKNGIRLMYQDFKHPEYKQLHGKFEPYLSAADLLLNCGPESRAILLGNK